MTMIITAFERSPDGGRGLARDTRVRWALEEIGIDYKVRPVSFAAMKEPAHLAIHPFGQIPTLEHGDLALFESGAIILHLAETRPGLLPLEAAPRNRAIAWMFAALNTMETPILELATARLLEADKPWTAERLPLLQDRIRTRLRQLSAHLGKKEWLDGTFSAGDLLMVSVLLRLKASGLLDEIPNIAAYVARGEGRVAGHPGPGHGETHGFGRLLPKAGAVWSGRRQGTSGISATKGLRAKPTRPTWSRCRRNSTTSWRPKHEARGRHDVRAKPASR